MKGFRLFQRVTGGIIGGAGLVYGGYAFGSYSTVKKLETPEAWQNLSSQSRLSIFSAAMQNVFGKELGSDEARHLLPDILDAAKVPHGDLSVSSKKVHSGRYFISQWQRSAVGACVLVLGKDKAGDICIAVGNQRGLLRHPQGYMEVGLPKEDLTGLRAKKASRVNGKTGELVPMDHTIEDNAIREVHEEIGLAITKDQLRLVGIKSDMEENPTMIAAKYYVLLENTPDLITIDQEFANDDLSKPRWVKIKNIVCKDSKYYADTNSLPFDNATITQLDVALQDAGYSELCTGYYNEQGMNSFRP